MPDAADAFLRKMRMYKLRAASRDRICARPTPWAGFRWLGDRHGARRSAGFGERVIATKAEVAEWLPADDQFAARRISAGVLEQGPDFAIDTTFPISAWTSSMASTS